MSEDIKHDPNNTSLFFECQRLRERMARMESDLDYYKNLAEQYCGECPKVARMEEVVGAVNNLNGSFTQAHGSAGIEFVEQMKKLSEAVKALAALEKGK